MATASAWWMVDLLTYLTAAPSHIAAQYAFRQPWGRLKNKNISHQGNYHYVWHCIYLVIRQASAPQNTRFIRHARPFWAFGGRLGFNLFMHTHRDNHPSWFDFRSHWQPPPHSVSNNLHVRLSGFVFQNVTYRIQPETPADDLLGTGHSFGFDLKPPVWKIVLFNGFIHLLILRKNNKLNAYPSFFRRPFIIRTHQHCGCFEYPHNML